jgi:chloramphenicol 3-O phosphotransferase
MAHGADSGTIVILNGTSSAGKTSILKALQRTLPAPYLDAGIDRFIFMLPSPYLNRPLWDDVLGLADRSGAMGHQLFSGMHRAIAALAQAGNNVLADHVIVEPSWVTECAALFAHLPAYLIGVHCALEIVEERERSRGDRTLGQARTQFGVVHQHVVYDFVVDSGAANADECAAAIQAYLTSGARPTAFARLRTQAAAG